MKQYRDGRVRWSAWLGRFRQDIPWGYLKGSAIGMVLGVLMIRFVLMPLFPHPRQKPTEGSAAQGAANPNPHGEPLAANLSGQQSVLPLVFGSNKLWGVWAYARLEDGKLPVAQPGDNNRLHIGESNLEPVFLILSEPFPIHEGGHLPDRFFIGEDFHKINGATNRPNDQAQRGRDHE